MAPVRVGVLGGGQLGRMLALAGYPLGLQFRFWDPSPEAPVRELAECITAPYEDGSAFDHFARHLAAVTYEFENVPASLVARLEGALRVSPSSKALTVAQDRLLEKELFSSLGIPCAKFCAVNSLEELRSCSLSLGFPCILKTRRFGYDGKGQWIIPRAEEISPAWEALGGTPLILEESVSFDRELSIIACASDEGVIALYPLVQNLHAEGILRVSLPQPDSGKLTEQARAIASHIVRELHYTGILAIETFERDGVLVANEIAPRVHNSGHWTIEGAETSQFENHLRAVMQLPLGPAALQQECAMVNLIGAAPAADAILKVEGAHLHLYAKNPRPGRKIGHITVTAPDRKALFERLRLLGAVMPNERNYIEEVLT